jgi:hypothetical protein
MKRWIHPLELLRLARELAGVGAGRGKPQHVKLRRAVSSAYYAVFHRLALRAAYAALPGGTDSEAYGLARHVNHAAVRDVCEWIGGSTPPRHLDGVVKRLRSDADVTMVAQVFIQLQERREAADYDHEADFTRAGVINLVERAAEAVSVAFRRRASDEFCTFFSLILLRTSIGRA